MKTKVIFVTTVFDNVNTGPGIYARYLWDAFREDSNVDFHVVAPSMEEEHPRLHSAGFGQNSLDTYRRVQRLARRLAEEIEGECIIHGNAAHSMSEFFDYPGPWIAQVNDYEAADVWTRPISILRGRGIRRLLSLVWRRWHEKRVVNSATAVVCNSEFTRKRILQNYTPRPEGRVLTIHKSVDTSDFRREVRLDDPFPERPKGARIVFVGTDWRRKGLPDLLQAVMNLSRNLPHIRLIVGGPSVDSDREEIELATVRLGIDEHVQVVGRVEREELPAIYQHSDVFVLPSREEALGVAILEAMAAGLPVIASSTGGIPEIVSDGINGLTFPAGDSEQLTRCLEKVIGDAELRKTLVRHGFETAKEFDVDRMIEAVRDLYIFTFSQSFEESS